VRSGRSLLWALSAVLLFVGCGGTESRSASDSVAGRHNEDAGPFLRWPPLIISTMDEQWGGIDTSYGLSDEEASELRRAITDGNVHTICVYFDSLAQQISDPTRESDVPYMEAGTFAASILHANLADYIGPHCPDSYQIIVEAANRTIELHGDWGPEYPPAPW